MEPNTERRSDDSVAASTPTGDFLGASAIGAAYVVIFVLVVGFASSWNPGVVIPMTLVATATVLAAIGIGILGAGRVNRLIVPILRRIIFLGA